MANFRGLEKTVDGLSQRRDPALLALVVERQDEEPSL